ncbi:hypothetical protein N9L06_04080 [Mariniblastus sp.]|nr:hypothetical protein [Mariniblastus sp.]
MSLSELQVRTLMQLVVTTTPDDMNCDGCFGRVAEFAEIHLANQPLSESMRIVEEHLKNCPCCKDEFEALKLALASVGV